MGHVVAGGVAMQDLQQEGVNSHHRCQQAIPPGVAEFAAKALDRCRLQVHSHIGLDSCEGAEDTDDHPWSPGRRCVLCKTPSSGRPLLPSTSTNNIRRITKCRTRTCGYLRGIRIWGCISKGLG